MQLLPTPKIVVKGDVKKVKYLGFKISAGEMVIEGSTDLYVGAWMTGGKILAKGNVEAFAATGMKGGELIIEGNAGNYLGAAYRGDWRGMSGGKILVKGNAGSRYRHVHARRGDRRSTAMSMSMS